MTKVLLKKQLRELFAGFFVGKKGKKSNKLIGKILIGFIFLTLFASGGVLIYMGAELICEPLINVGFSWLYFALVSMLSVVAGVLGSVFTTYSSIYCAKDNDFLLSMPIPPRKIIFVRMVMVLITTLLYESVVLIPSLAVWFAAGKTSPTQIAFTLLSAVLITLFSVTLCSLLGLAVSLALLKVRRKNIVTVVASVAFIAAYYYLYYNAYSLLMGILANPAALGDKIKSVLFYFYHLGLAADGKISSLLIVFLITAVFMCLFFLLATKTFLRSATVKVAAAKSKRAKNSFSQRSAAKALFSKEKRAFFGNAHYMLNTAMASLMMPIAAGAIFFKGSSLKNALSTLPAPIPKDMLALIACGLTFFMLTMNDITAPSISLEGKNIWIYKSMPVKAAEVFKAKVKLQLLLTIPPLIIFLASVLWVFEFNAVLSLLLIVASLGFELFYALLGLCLNLKWHKLDWTNDIVPIKQSLSVTVSIFGGWGVIFALAALYKLLYLVLSPALFIAGVIALLSIVCFLFIGWLKRRGAAIYESL